MKRLDELMLEKIYLVDTNEKLVKLWKFFFKDYSENVEVIHGDYFKTPTDAIVSPANCFGFMDGGIDKAIRDIIPGVEQKVQETIFKYHHGELPVGRVEIVPTDNSIWPYLVVAPTMRIPQSIEYTDIPYQVFRSILLEIERHNEVGAYKGVDFQKEINTLVCCGLGTGVGRMDPYFCAIQMYRAYQQILGNGKPASFYEIINQHKSMIRM